MKLIFYLVLLLFGTLELQAGEWSLADEDYVHYSGELKYFNRASCAKESLKPAKSVFLIVDNVNMAKAVFRLGKKTGRDTKLFTDQGIQRFRYSIAKLLQLTSDRILRGELPIIPLQKERQSEELRVALERCESNDCGELYAYLSEQWGASQTSTQGSYSSCKVIKKFSTLHSHLNVSKPDRVLLEEMARELKKPDEFTYACNDFSDVSNPEVGLYQFDLKVDDKKFQSIGFDFWNTLKIYLSWGFRNAPEMGALAYPFDFLFKSVNLEEMLLFFPNGCASIKPAECSQSDLSMNNLRFLTKATADVDWDNIDMVRSLPEKTPNDLFSKPLPLTEQDLLNLGDFDSADEWVKNFRSNFVTSRGYNKIKLLKALGNLKLIHNGVPVTVLMNKIQKELSDLGPEAKQELYYLCSEFSLAADRRLGTIRDDLWRLKEIEALKPVVRDLTGMELTQFWEYFEETTARVNDFCKSLQQKEIWEDNFELNKDGFAFWYRQLVYEKRFSFSEDTSLFHRKVERPFLRLKGGEAVCHTGPQCARQVLDSIMSLSAVSTSLSALAPAASHVFANGMSNPYASHMACGAYDPWAKRNKIISDFAADLVQSAAFGLIPTPVYVSANLDPKRVVSFDTLVKEGKIFYDPNFNNKRLKLSLIADLGPMIGVPCALSVSGSKQNPFEFYMFNGISINTCRARQTNEITVGESGDAVTEEKFREACGSCAINLQTVASSASIINPLFRVSFFLIKGVVRLVNNLRDPHDLARDWVVYPQKVALSYRHDGEISKSCAKKLIKGKDCLPRSCEAEAVMKLVEEFKVSPKRTDFSCLKGTGRIEVKECAEPIYVSFNRLGKKSFEVDTDCRLEKRIK